MMMTICHLYIEAKKGFKQTVRSPGRSFLRLHSIVFSITPSLYLLPTPASLKCTNNGPTAHPFRSSANHSLSSRPCHRIPLLPQISLQNSAFRPPLSAAGCRCMYRDLYGEAILDSFYRLILHGVVSAIGSSRDTYSLLVRTTKTENRG